LRHMLFSVCARGMTNASGSVSLPAPAPERGEATGRYKKATAGIPRGSHVAPTWLPRNPGKDDCTGSSRERAMRIGMRVYLGSTVDILVL